VNFIQGSVFDPCLEGPFDASISRYVLHHVANPGAFIRRQAELLRPGGVLIACDHTTDPDPDRAQWHKSVEKARDFSHTECLTPGRLIDLCISAGLGEIRLTEESFQLDFDEWFDRATSSAAKDDVRSVLLSGPGARGFAPTLLENGRVRIDSWRAIVRGTKP
jgi:SAM-dependent methyltransferase